MRYTMRYKNKYTYSVNNHTPIKGLDAISPFYKKKWNDRVTRNLSFYGVKNLAWYDEFTANEYKAESVDDVWHVYQFEATDRECHWCQKIKSNLWYTPIQNGQMKGTTEQATEGILKAIKTNAFCAPCAFVVGI